MNYQNENLNGILDSMINAAFGWHDLQIAQGEAQRQEADSTLQDAQVQGANSRSDLFTRSQAFQNSLDSEKAKRYITIGAAVGVPLIIGLFLLKKGKSK